MRYKSIMRCKVLIAGILVSVACIVLGTLAMLPARPGVTKANFDRIEKGMTRAQVEEFFGQPGMVIRHDGPGGRAAISWEADDRSGASVGFLNDYVTGAIWNNSPETVPDKIRRWLHLR